MRIGFYSHYQGYRNNKMFCDPSSPIGDNLMYPFFYLGKELKKLGHHASTVDTQPLKNFDAVVFMDFPGFGNKYFTYARRHRMNNLYLLALESPLIQPDNYRPKNHAWFKKIFTWDDTVIDHKKYFKINYSHQMPKEFDFVAGGDKTLCALIASNKSVNRQQELYSERIRAIRWFEANHPKDFDLYGNGWDRHQFQGTLLGVNIARLNRLTFLTKLFRPHYPSYQGSVASKHETYKKYKFSICYENAEGFLGYITEKIFDCFLAGCVPVYLGANNIADHIPKNTFIDKRNFTTYAKLYDYLAKMPPQEYRAYVQAIKNFLPSKQAHPFSAEYFADTLIKEIVYEP